ncbi:nuclear transport factor 2 family protein [Streptomyces sp. NPDC004267]|uniref:nuclear transport factor 2 family protein n=1 Tax=Streptomyces sp. NPDC004267 TaxID=3364694 RepID=UPI00369D30AD
MAEDAFVTALAARFDAEEERLRAVARRMLGGYGEVDGVLAQARAGVGDGVREWLDSVVGRACVRRLQGRVDAEPPGPARPSGKVDTEPPGPARPSGKVDTEPPGPARPSGEVDAVWLALLVVLDALGPAERLAYVLHDLFGLPLDDTARITGTAPEEAGRLARAARRRVRGGGPGGGRPGGDPARQRALVESFLAAARARDPRALAALLHPDVVAHSPHGTAHGPAAVAENAATAFARTAPATTRPALIDGAIGVVAFAAGRPVAAVAFTLHGDRIVALDITTGEQGVRGLALTFPDV